MKYCSFLFLILYLFACSNQQSSIAPPSFYYWKMEGKDTMLEKGIIQLQMQHLYIKWFDIAWQENKKITAPVAVLQASPNIRPLFNNHFSPVAFIHNGVFLHIDSAGCKLLASQLYDAIQKKAQQLQQVLNLQQPDIYNKITEIQIDCDWTKTTKDKYFYFLHCLKNEIPNKLLSVTLRLFPYKYQSEMGIPPADKVVLMCYNMDAIKNVNTQNSIFNLDILKKYLIQKPYPKPLEIALPTFGWYVLFRNEQFIGIVYQEEFETISTATKEGSKPNWFTITNDIESNHRYFREGDALRKEFPSHETLINGAALLLQHFPNTQQIHYFHLDDYSINTYENTIHHLHSL